jgi:uncharacterized protein (DUF1330 family)
MSDKVVLIVSIWLRDNDVEGFERFEAKMAQLQALHGGRIDRAIRVGGSDDKPFEVHIVSFDSIESLKAYRADPQMQALAEIRHRIIEKSVVIEGRDVDPY